MNPPDKTQAPDDARLAGGLMSMVQQLQKNRFGGIRELQGAPIGGEAADSSLFNKFLNTQDNEQKQDSSPTPGALQEEGSEEQGRQRNVGPAKTQSSFR